MVEQANSTLDQIKQKVRRLVMTGDSSGLPDSEIERQINTFVEQDFPFDLRINNFIERQVFFTEQGEDRYPVDLNAIRQPSGPATSSGRIMDWMQDYRAFDRVWPKIFVTTTLSGDGTAGAYSTTLGSIPLLRREVVVSTILSSGQQDVLYDDGEGALANSDATSTGTVNYTTGAISFTFFDTVDTTETITIQYVQANRQQPYTIFYRNDEFILRPVPDGVYKIEYDAFMVPAPFIASNQNPQVNMWWEYIAYGAAKKILEDRQDIESLQAIMPAMKEKESIIVNQTAAQNDQMRSSTIYWNNTPFYTGWYDGIQ